MNTFTQLCDYFTPIISGEIRSQTALQAMVIVVPLFAYFVDFSMYVCVRVVIKCIYLAL